MAKGNRQAAKAENGAAWDSIANFKWLREFPFAGGPGWAFEAKAAIVPAKRGEILQGSSLLLALHFTNGDKCAGVNLTLSFTQAKAVSEILHNFLVSRETAHEAIRGAFINKEGALRWGMFPQAV